VQGFPNKSADIFNINANVESFYQIFFLTVTKKVFTINTYKKEPLRALLYTLMFEKTALLEKSTFQPS
jgi:hypothetical protein